jgi:NTE family protein
VCDKVGGCQRKPHHGRGLQNEYCKHCYAFIPFYVPRQYFSEREKCDLLIEPYNLYGYSNTELEKAEEIFGQGYNTANEVLNQLLEEKGKIWK